MPTVLKSTESVIQIEHLSVALSGDFMALRDVSVAFSAGKIVGLIGPSGAGKTTLIRSIVGRQKLSMGSVQVLGLPAGSAALRSRISYMTQENSVYGDLTVHENLRYFATMLGLKRRESAASVAQVLATTDMQSLAGQLVSKLSGGEKQRVSLAAALLGSPEVLVLDEPTVGLDPVLREQIWKLFYGLAADGKTLIVSSHVMDEAERCNDLLLIRDGAILAHDSPANLRTQTGTNTVEQSFLKLVGNNASESERAKTARYKTEHDHTQNGATT